MEESDYMPAIIGLFGVIVGGIINVIAQRRRDVEMHVREIRKECSTLAKAATDYSATMAQFVREINDDKDKARQAPPGSDVLNELRDDEYWQRIGGELFQALEDTIALSLQVTATKDYRVGQQATVLRLTLISSHNDIAPAFEPRGHIDTKRAEELREKINTETETLLGMIMPRSTERFCRFRSHKSVSRMDEKGKKK